MPFQYSFDPTRNLITAVGSDQVSLDDRARIVHALAEDPALPRTCNVLIDVSRVANEPSPSEIDPIARLTERLQLRFGGSIAIANLHPYRLTTSAMIALDAKRFGGDIRVFETLEEAHAWLDNC